MDWSRSKKGDGQHCKDCIEMDTRGENEAGTTKGDIQPEGAREHIGYTWKEAVKVAKTLMSGDVLSDVFVPTFLLPPVTMVSCEITQRIKALLFICKVEELGGIIT